MHYQSPDRRVCAILKLKMKNVFTRVVHKQHVEKLNFIKSFASLTNERHVYISKFSFKGL